MITFGPKFPVPDLGDAFRRSFFVRNNNEVTLMDLVRILHALNPRALDNVPMTYRGVLPAVWGELKKVLYVQCLCPHDYIFLLHLHSLAPTKCI